MSKTSKEIPTAKLEELLELMSNPNLQHQLEKLKKEKKGSIQKKYAGKIAVLSDQIKVLEKDREAEITALGLDPAKSTKSVGGRVRRTSLQIGAERKEDEFAGIAVLKHIKTHKEEGTKTSDVNSLTERPGAVIRILLDQKKIISKGQKKGTRYYPA